MFLLSKQRNAQHLKAHFLRSYATIVKPFVVPVYQQFPLDTNGMSEHAALEIILRKEANKTPADEEHDKLSKYVWKLIRAKQRNKKSEQIERMWNDMKIDGVKPTLSLFDILINAVVRARRIDLAHEFYGDMVNNHKIEPSVELLSYMVNVCKFSVEPEKAQFYMDTLLEKVAPPTTVTPIHTGKTSDASGTNESSGTNDANVSSGTINASVSNESSGANGKGRSSLTTNMFNQLINVYARAGQEEGALNSFRQMRELGLKPDIFTYGSLIKLYSRQQRLSDALALVEQMKQLQGQEHYDPQYSPPVVDTAIYNMLIHACKMPEQLQTAFTLFDEMQQVGVPRDNTTYGTLISKLVQAKQYQTAHETYQKMKQVRLPATQFIFSCLMKACVAQANDIAAITYSPPAPSTEPRSTLAPSIKNSPGELAGRKTEMMKQVIITVRSYVRDNGSKQQLECKPLVEQLESQWKTMRTQRNKLWAQEYKTNLRNDMDYMIRVRTSRGMKLEQESTKRREAKKKREGEEKLARQQAAAKRQEQLWAEDEMDN